MRFSSFHVHGVKIPRTRYIVLFDEGLVNKLKYPYEDGTRLRRFAFLVSEPGQKRAPSFEAGATALQRRLGVPNASVIRHSMGLSVIPISVRLQEKGCYFEPTGNSISMPVTSVSRTYLMNAWRQGDYGIYHLPADTFEQQETLT